MWNKIQKIYIGNQLVRPQNPVLFDFWDWTNSQWTTFWTQWTINKTSSSISFSNGNNFCKNYLSGYEIDIGKDFLFEFNATIPSTSASFHYIGLGTSQNGYSTVFIGTNYISNGKISYAWPGINWTNSGENIASNIDYFIKREWNVLTLWRWWVTKYTDNNFTETGTVYVGEQNYRSTLIINTAKFTYL